MITMEELKGNMCKWPIGDPRKKKTFHFCGSRREEGCSYCAEHNEMSHRGYISTQEQAPLKKAA